MIMKFVRNLAVVSALGFVMPVMAQYPTIPQDVQKWSDSLQKAEQVRSDEAWAKALPIIQQEAKQGRPYIPWAARPYDLPQADILAFLVGMLGTEATPSAAIGQHNTVD